MKNLLLAVTLIMPFLGITQNSYTTKKGKVHLLGAIDLKDLEKEPYAEWFNNPSELDYTISHAEKLKNTKVKVVLGTWCGDSKEWVPEFVKLWKVNNLPIENLEFIALHNEEDLYKSTPSGIEKGLNVHRVPTFIFYDTDEEIGRIVESPLNDLSTDVSQIAAGLSSKPRYRAAAILYEVFKQHPIDSLYAKSNYRTILNKVYGEITKPSELNTLGYVLLAQGKIEQAEFAFYLNRRIFKYDPNTWDSLGEVYLKQGKYDEAKTNYERVLELDHKNENAQKMLVQIREKQEKS